MSESSSISALHNEICRLLQQHQATHYFESHCEFATLDNEAQADLESLTGVQLQPDLQEFFRVNNRSLPFINNYRAVDPKNLVRGIQGSIKLTKDGTFQQIYTRIDDWQDGRWDSKYFQRTYWSPAWIAFAEDSCGNEYCIDHDPAEAGQIGQMLEMEFQDGQGPYLSLFPDLKTFLKIHVELLKQKRFDLEDGHVEYHDLTYNERRELIKIV